MKSQFTRPSRVDFTGSFDWEVQGSAFDALRSMSSDDIRNLLFCFFWRHCQKDSLAMVVRKATSTSEREHRFHGSCSRQPGRGPELTPGARKCGQPPPALNRQVQRAKDRKQLPLPKCQIQRSVRSAPSHAAPFWEEARSPLIRARRMAERVFPPDTQLT